MKAPTIVAIVGALAVGIVSTVAIRGALVDDGVTAEPAHAGEPGHGKHTGPEHGAHKSAAVDIIDLKNEICPVMGGKALPDVYTDYEGVRIHWCCPGCDSTFKKDPKTYLKKLGIDDLDEFKRQHAAGKHGAHKSAAVDIIDLKNETCPVMGGKALPDVYTDYEGVRIHWCCPGCDSTFKKDPKTYLKKLGIDDLDEFKRKSRAGKKT